MGDGTGILVVGELADGAPISATLEALAAARALSDALGGEQVVVLLPGEAAGAAPQTAIAYGADAVCTVQDPALAGGNPEALTAAAEAAVAHVGPRFVIGSKTITGRDVMPRLAFRLGTALAQDCTMLGVDANGRLLATRPTYGGNTEATVVCLGTPAVAALRVQSVDALEPDPSRTGEATELSVSLEGAARLRTVERVEAATEGARLEDARVVVSGGRGLGGPEPFAQLDELASLLGGAVGASRAACDAGWVPSSYQVGLTGKTVTPELYFAIGISGASQHLAGCSNARNIVAINKDAGANIFKEARFGVVGDWQKVLPAFVEQLHELLH